ncbi:MAG TPA: hypothetical protein VGP93_08145 [Polyangiaceae bacterium]|nr:hypothetical protein [Polyangiaceae bacterium]
MSIIVVSLPFLARFAVEFLGFTLGALERPVHRSTTRGYAVTEADEHQPRSGSELLVQPLTAEETDGDAERQLKSDGPVAAKPFPVLLHRSGRAGAELACRPSEGQRPQALTHDSDIGR